MNFPKFLRTHFLQSTSVWLLLNCGTQFRIWLIWVFSLQGFTLFSVWRKSSHAFHHLCFFWPGRVIWDNVFKNWPSKTYHHIRPYDLGRPYQLKFFKGCLPQISCGPFLNALPMYVYRCLCVYMNIFRPWLVFEDNSILMVCRMFLGRRN